MTDEPEWPWYGYGTPSFPRTKEVRKIDLRYCHGHQEQVTFSQEGATTMRKLSMGLILAGALTFGLGTAQAVMINEWVSNDVSTDDYEFIELCGMPNESLDGLVVVLVEGEGSPAAGTIDRIIDLAGYSVGVSGYFVMGDAAVSPDLVLGAGFIENGGNNILLLSGFNAALFPVGTDIDGDDDCVADFPIGTVIDGVGYGYGSSAADCAYYYGIPTVGPDGTFDPAGGARCDDCDFNGGQWFMICLNGTEPPPTGTACLEADGYFIAFATPGAPNDCSPVPADQTTWGGLKELYK
jgi:hypothetical protein